VSKPRIIIIMDGGLIQNVLCDQEIEAAVIDYDTDGGEESYTTLIPQNFGASPERAFANTIHVELSPLDVSELWDVIIADEDGGVE